jgi:hypothetical protein
VVVVRAHPSVLGHRIRMLLALVAVAAPIGLLAQKPEPITAARVRALTREAEAEARGDKNEVVIALDRRFRTRWGDFESFPVSIVRREDLSIILSTPYMTYRRALAEYLRIGDPLAGIPWIDSGVVTVSPGQIGAPDITRVVVERDGKAVPPLEDRLKPMSFTNGSGETAVMHAGDVRFPMSAFAPGAAVTLTAVPHEGASFMFALDAGLLQTLK